MKSTWLKRWISRALGATLGTAVAAGLSGCAGIGEGGADLEAELSLPRAEIMVAAPLYEDNLRNQTLLARLSVMLDADNKSADDKAELLYELGLVYDRLGMDATARAMFTNALALRPRYSEPYNMLGLYLADEGQLQDSCAAFDAAVELSPGNYYVYFNRGISLYYAGRHTLAAADLQLFAQHYPQDPYILLWQYLNDRAQGGEDSARLRLRDRYAAVDARARAEIWGFELVRYYLGELPRARLFAEIRACRRDNTLFAEHLCEAYFYVGQAAKFAGRDKTAYDYFTLAQATQRFGFLELRCARREIRRLEQQHGLEPWAELEAEAGE